MSLLWTKKIVIKSFSFYMYAIIFSIAWILIRYPTYIPQCRQSVLRRIWLPADIRHLLPREYNFWDIKNSCCILLETFYHKYVLGAPFIVTPLGYKLLAPFRNSWHLVLPLLHWWCDRAIIYTWEPFHIFY